MAFELFDTAIRIEPEIFKQILILTAAAILPAVIFCRDLGIIRRIFVGIFAGIFLTFGVFFHEFTHLVTANIFGVDILMIRFTAVGASTIPGNLRQISDLENLVIAFSGPASNIFLGIIALYLSGKVGRITLRNLGEVSGYMSIIFGLYNYLPIWGDGKRIVDMSLLLAGIGSGNLHILIETLWIFALLLFAVLVFKRNFREA